MTRETRLQRGLPAAYHVAASVIMTFAFAMVSCEDDSEYMNVSFTNGRISYTGMWKSRQLQYIVFEQGRHVQMSSQYEDTEPQDRGLSAVPKGLYEDGNKVTTGGLERRVFIATDDTLHPVPVTQEDIEALRLPDTDNAPRPDLSAAPSWERIRSALEEHRQGP